MAAMNAQERERCDDCKDAISDLKSDFRELRLILKFIVALSGLGIVGLGQIQGLILKMIGG